MLFIFSTPVLVRHLWQLKTVVFLHWCLIRADLLSFCQLAISYTYHFSELPYHRLEHFINLPFYQLAFHQLHILSTCHFIHSQKFILVRVQELRIVVGWEPAKSSEVAIARCILFNVRQNVELTKRPGTKYSIG